MLLDLSQAHVAARLLPHASGPLAQRICITAIGTTDTTAAGAATYAVAVAAATATAMATTAFITIASTTVAIATAATAVRLCRSSPSCKSRFVYMFLALRRQNPSVLNFT